MPAPAIAALLGRLVPSLVQGGKVIAGSTAGMTAPQITAALRGSVTAASEGAAVGGVAKGEVVKGVIANSGNLSQRLEALIKSGALPEGGAGSGKLVPRAVKERLVQQGTETLSKRNLAASETERFNRDADSREALAESAEQAASALKKQLIGALVLAPGAIMGTMKAITSWGERVAASQEHLRRYSGVLQNAYAGLEHQQIQIEAQLAQKTGASTAMLVNEVKDTRKALQPITEDWIIFRNLLLAYLLELVQAGAQVYDVAKNTTIIGNIWESMKEYLAGDKKADSEYMAHLREIAAGRIGPGRVRDPDVAAPAAKAPPGSGVAVGAGLMGSGASGVSIGAGSVGRSL